MVERNVEIPRKKVFITGKSGVKEKIASNSRKIKVRYFTCQSADDPLTGYKFELREENGDTLPFFIFSELLVPLKNPSRGRPNPLYDKNAEGEIFQNVYWLSGMKPSDIKATGKRYISEKEISINLRDVVFFNDHLLDKESDVKIPSTDLGFPTFSPVLNSVNLEGVVKIHGTFESRLRPFFDGERKKNFKKCLIYKEGSADLSRSDLSMLERSVFSVEEEERMKSFLKELREKIREGNFLSVEDVEQIARSTGISGIDAADLLEKATFRKNYEPLFFDMLKKSQENGKPVYYSDSGFIFFIKGRWVWEVPEYANATYIFDGQILSAGSLLALLQNAAKNEIYKSKEMKTRAGFIKRVIHPKDVENEEYLNRWFSEILD